MHKIISNYSNFSNESYMTDDKQPKFDKLFNEFFSFAKELPVNSSSPWQPPTDVYETPDEIVVKMCIPGSRSEDINVSFSNETLAISGYRADNTLHEKICFYQVEIRYGYFERNISVPKSIETNDIQATYKDGFLQINLPKKKPQAPQSYSIPINIK